jgi:AbrB family looped-hinge helix DNA binding protein
VTLGKILTGMRLTSKGQVTIPIEIREQLGLVAGSEVEFELDGDSVRLRKVADSTGRGAALVAFLRGRGGGELSTDEIMELTRA